jgi:hypothetical protein
LHEPLIEPTHQPIGSNPVEDADAHANRNAEYGRCRKCKRCALGSAFCCGGCLIGIVCCCPGLPMWIGAGI